MSKDWTLAELETASKKMKAAGYMSYEEFCEMLNSGKFKMASHTGNASPIIAAVKGEQPMDDKI